jgi:hypothetical protein
MFFIPAYGFIEGDYSKEGRILIPMALGKASITYAHFVFFNPRMGTLP